MPDEEIPVDSAADALAGVCETEDDVVAVASAVRMLHHGDSVPIVPDRLAETAPVPLSEEDTRELLLHLHRTGILVEGGDGSSEDLDEPALETAVELARIRVARPEERDNEVVANLPRDELDEIAGSFGSLVVRLRELVGGAEERVVILNPFFTTQVFDMIHGSLTAAARQGAEIWIVTRSLTYGDAGDNWTFVRRLAADDDIAGNLRLFEYVDEEGGRAATIHAKMTIVDGRAAYLGTANLTHRGLHDNLELGVIFRDQTVDRLERFVDDLLDSPHLHEVVVDGDLRRR